jgi:Cys-tRNA(Pro)/Cys-tRNA(Cys) deacylase
MHPKISVLLSQGSRYEFAERRHADFGSAINSPADFARALGYSPDRIAKTVLVANKSINSNQRGPSDYVAVVVPAQMRMNFVIVASMANWKGCEVARPDELAAVTQYPSKGVSPLGLGELSVYLDESLLAHSTIVVGAGEIGVEIEIDPRYVVELARAITTKVAA